MERKVNASQLWKGASSVVMYKAHAAWMLDCKMKSILLNGPPSLASPPVGAAAPS